MRKKKLLLHNTNWINVEPNFTRNRFDLSSPDNSFLMECCINNKKYYIPIYKKGLTYELGVYLTQFSKEEFSQLIQMCLKKFKFITRLKVASSINNYVENSLLEENTDYITVLPDSEAEFLEKLSSQSRYNLKRKQKRLLKDFENVQVKIYHNDIPDKILEKYFEYKQITHCKNYHLSPKQYILKYHVTDAYVLCINNDIEAIALNSVVEKNSYLENVTYNINFSKYSLGILIMYEMIKDCINKGYKNIFWGTNHEYKKHFANSIVPTYSGYIYKYRFLLGLKYLFKHIRFSKKMRIKN